MKKCFAGCLKSYFSLLSMILICSLLLCACSVSSSDTGATPGGQNAALGNTGTTPGARTLTALAAPVYPERHTQAGTENYTNTDALAAFYQTTMSAFLQPVNGKNCIYSPINVYLALAMLAEVTAGDSRQQILNLLGAEDVEELRQIAQNLWTSNYVDSDTVTSLPGNSFWLSDEEEYQSETLKNLADYYYAAAFSGKMGSEELNQALRDWINEQTNDLLKDQTDGLAMNPETILALVSTLYFKAGWQTPFSEEATTTEIFHGSDGDVECSMMHRRESQAYYAGANFQATALNMRYSGEMWLFLPDEGVTPEELAADPEVYDVLLGRYSEGSVQGKEVVLSLPKFDVTSKLDLIEGLKELGVKDVFSPRVSDFTPLTDADELAVTRIEHAARVKTDESGVEAAAYTAVMVEECAAIPLVPVELVFDRPFLFAITGDDGALLFTGVVNVPE